MSLNKSSVIRTVLLGIGCAALAASALLLLRHSLAEGFLLAFAGLSVVSVHQTAIDYDTRFTVSSFIAHVARGRSSRSTAGLICDIVSWFCLAAAFISWVAAR